MPCEHLDVKRQFHDRLLNVWACVDCDQRFDPQPPDREPCEFCSHYHDPNKADGCPCKKCHQPEPEQKEELKLFGEKQGKSWDEAECKGCQDYPQATGPCIQCGGKSIAKPTDPREGYDGISMGTDNLVELVPKQSYTKSEIDGKLARVLEICKARDDAAATCDDILYVKTGDECEFRRELLDYLGKLESIQICSFGKRLEELRRKYL